MPAEETLGYKFGVYVPVGSTPTLVAAARSTDFEETAEAVDASHAGNFPWATKKPGQQDSSLDLENVHLVDTATGELDASHQALLDAKRNGDEVTVQVRRPGGKQDEIPMIVTSVSISMPYNEVATNSISLEGTGKPTTTTA
jgi:predicted secreted protein